MDKNAEGLTNSKSHIKLIDSAEIFKKVLKATQQEFPQMDDDVLRELASKRTKTWIDFLHDPDDIPLFVLFKNVGELSNLQITNVAVEYPTEPSIRYEVSFKGENGVSYYTLDEAQSETEFALRNQIPGAEKLQNVLERLEMEMIDSRKIRKVGNSLIVSIPESIISLFGINEGDYLSFIYKYGEVKVKKERNLG